MMNDRAGPEQRQNAAPSTLHDTPRRPGCDLIRARQANALTTRCGGVTVVKDETPPADETTMPPEAATGVGVEILEKCQQAIGYRFRQPDLLRSALTHASGANTRLASNERMEFLGDAVLGLVV